ncbi:hypothetical protein [Mesorhizobium sp. CN2-181]|uniref:hypothetical protein n=1 Tax=Mesorhizobium yinganensis TaxID=3157707 RepID=UPI0032B8683F
MSESAPIGTGIGTGRQGIEQNRAVHYPGKSRQIPQKSGLFGTSSHGEGWVAPRFKTGALNRSAIPPRLDFVSFFSFRAALSRAAAAILLPNAFQLRGFTAFLIGASTCSAAFACIPGITCEYKSSVMAIVETPSRSARSSG